MGIGSGTAMLIGGLASAGGSVASGIMGGNAAQNAAAAQMAAEQKAAQYQQQQSQNALNFQQNEWDTEQANMAPWLQSGTGALSNLNYLMGVNPMGSSGFGATPPPAYTGGASSPSSFTPSFAQMPSNPGGVAPSMGAPVNPGAPTQAGGIRQRVASPTALSAGGPQSGVVKGINATFNPTTGAPNPISIPGNGGMAPVGAPPSGSSPAPFNPGGGFGSLMQPYGKTFSAPTLQDMMQNDPGYQARMNLGQQAMEQSAAARGNLLTGGTLQAENQLAQDYASNEYNNFYNQAYNTYATNYNQYEQNQANQFNRLAAMAGMGQSAAGTLGTLGQAAASGVTNNLLSTGQMVGNDYTNAGAANASGIVGSANALGGMASGIGNSISGMMNLSLLQNLLGGGGGSSVMPYSWLNGTADPLGLGGAS